MYPVPLPNDSVEAHVVLQDYIEQKITLLIDPFCAYWEVQPLELEQAPSQLEITVHRVETVGMNGKDCGSIYQPIPQRVQTWSEKNGELLLRLTCRIANDRLQPQPYHVWILENQSALFTESRAETEREFSVCA